MKTVMPELVIGDLKAEIPIIQGGMAIGISLSGLASAVASEGGIGIIATAGIGINQPGHHKDPAKADIKGLKEEIHKARELTKGILGVNIMVALTNYADMVKTSIAEGIDIIFSGGGLPLNLAELVGENRRTKLVPIVSSARAAKLLCKRWYERGGRLPDAVVVEGPKAGGHLGFKPKEINDPNFALEKLIPEVIAAVKFFEDLYGVAIPVIAAGGIFTGEDIYRFMQMGAAGVQMGTRFVITDECDASQEFKQAYLDAGEDDIVIIKSPVGMPGRAIGNKFIDDVNEEKRKPYRCTWHCIKTCNYEESLYCIFSALNQAQKGNFKHGYAFAGSNAYRAMEIVTVHTLMEELVQEYKEASIKLSLVSQLVRTLDIRRQHLSLDIE
jgi:nitronate monooxygenase